MTRSPVVTPFRPPEPAAASNGMPRTRKPAPQLTMTDVPAPSSMPPEEMPPARLWTITPEVAEQLIRRHEHIVGQHETLGRSRTGRNRAVRMAGAGTYGRDMKTGKWKGRNGETVKIAYDGTFTDGQHRFYGCMEEKVPFETFVVFGVDPADQDTIDTGIKRKVQDQLQLRGEVNASNLATIARWAWRWLRGVRSRGGSGNPVPSELEIIEFIESDERLRMATAWAMRAYAESRSVRPSVYGMAWLLFHGTDYVAAEVFLPKVADGADIGHGHPAYTFRAHMARARDRGEKTNEHEQLALLIMAWNAFKEGREIFTLKLPAGGLTAGNYPEPK